MRKTEALGALTNPKVNHYTFLLKMLKCFEFKIRIFSFLSQSFFTCFVFNTILINDHTTDIIDHCSKSLINDLLIGYIRLV